MQITILVVIVTFTIAVVILCLVLGVSYRAKVSQRLDMAAQAMGLRDATGSPALLVDYGVYPMVGRFERGVGKAFEGWYRGRALITFSRSEYVYVGHYQLVASYQYVVIKLRVVLPATLVIPSMWRQKLRFGNSDQSMSIPSPVSHGWLAKSADPVFLYALVAHQANVPWLMLESHPQAYGRGAVIGFRFVSDDLVVWSDKASTAAEFPFMMEAASCVADWLEQYCHSVTQGRPIAY